MTTNGYIEIPLTRGYAAIIDVIDADLAECKWHYIGRDGEGYASRKIWKNQIQETIYLHRVIMQRVLGRALAKGEKTDHKNLNRLDCRRENLRIATNQENARNRGAQRNNKSGYKGVYFDKQCRKWVAKIRTSTKSIRTSGYETPEDAHQAYIELARVHFGEFARADGKNS